ncbi:hypothetical protein [Aeromicrobium duanguangcaii]|uniref:Uncharacterized protein n=1 Tax=Aeromicrobium duanguangcaii TaxID=2968086 RepID=A0ABY5KKA4_9ACTN|nr:hypothetical protein [Aeromicrobium duanguangcaii]MCD9154144.1 hypothetical protein [Aeromicrobium duanguangcaii]MCL3837879.1 hypothetical protein [Aeromicrobium duanguangcaii]UUI68783.1 hypothetical protein NP095_01345 [Aeromicrobium duanguangcaii]
MTFVFAAVSAFAAGVLFRSDDWPQRDHERGWRLILRFLALSVMVTAAIGASSLFGAEGSRRAVAIAAGVLWLPPLLVTLVFARTGARSTAGSGRGDA